MSVLIKGMKMPKDGCKDCLLVKRGNVFDICPILKREVNGNVERGGKPYDCPLVELPDHGDLIDRDALKNELFTDTTDCDLEMIEFEYVSGAPVVIPAERSEE